MWLITTKGFLSLVQDRHDPDLLQVRARVQDDITRHFPGAKIIVAHGGDYRYRARISKAQVSVKMADMILNDLHYTGHFKDVALAQTKTPNGRRTAYYAVWSAMAKMQDYAPYSKISRLEAAKRPTTGFQTNYRPPTTTASPALPTFSQAKSIPGNPWGERTTGSKIDAEEAAREPDTWESADDFWARMEAEDAALNAAEDETDDWYSIETLKAVEAAFGVDTETLSDEDLDALIDELNDLHITAVETRTARTEDDEPIREPRTKKTKAKYVNQPAAKRRRNHKAAARRARRR